MPAKFSFVHADFDGEGKRWRLMVDAGEFLTLADEEFTVTRSEVEENGDEIVGPFSVEQLVMAVQGLRTGDELSGPHRPTRSGVLHEPR